MLDGSHSDLKGLTAEALRALIRSERAQVEAERLARQHLEAENADLKAHVARLTHLVEEFRRARFGVSEAGRPSTVALRRRRPRRVRRGSFAKNFAKFFAAT